MERSEGGRERERIEKGDFTFKKAESKKKNGRTIREVQQKSEKTRSLSNCFYRGKNEFLPRKFTPCPCARDPVFA